MELEKELEVMNKLEYSLLDDVIVVDSVDLANVMQIEHKKVYKTINYLVDMNRGYSFFSFYRTEEGDGCFIGKTGVYLLINFFENLEKLNSITKMMCDLEDIEECTRNLRNTKPQK